MRKKLLISIISYILFAFALGTSLIYADEAKKDVTGNEIEALKLELSNKNKEIEVLKAKISELEKKMQLTVNDRVEILEAKLNEDFGAYEGISFKTFLSGGEEEIRVKIYPDCKNNYKEWSKLSNTKRTDFVKIVVNEIMLEFPDAVVKGYIKDSSKRTKVMDFYTDADGKIKNGSYKSFSVISELESKLNDSYNNYLSGMDMAIELAGNENNMVFRVNFIRSMYKNYWPKVSDNRIKDYLANIYIDIRHDLKNCNIKGVIYDVESEAEIAEYSKRGNSIEFYRIAE